MEHAPTPWRVSRANPSPTTGEWMIAGSSNGYLAEVRDCGGGSVAANARRIVACVNACAGLDTEQLEKFGLGTAFGTALFDVNAQCDELLAVLERIADTDPEDGTAWFHDVARAVIQKVRGGE